MGLIILPIFRGEGSHRSDLRSAVDYSAFLASRIIVLVFPRVYANLETWQPPFRQWRTLLVHLAVVPYEILQVYLHRCRVFDTCGV